MAVRIYDSAGRLVRSLDLGYRMAGYYVDRSKAAYWDGSNEWGEKVASGMYFYQFQAGDFAAIRKLIILQ
ncbi:FlgD immunoglobulin-like domain containing protein [Candidatus Poribacteria bacterium]